MDKLNFTGEDDAFCMCYMLEKTVDDMIDEIVALRKSVDYILETIQKIENIDYE